MSRPDITAIACNYREPTKTATKGSLAFVILTNSGGGHDRIFILSRSRGGRWIEKWEDIRRLCNFRLKTITKSNPRYLKLRACGFADLLLSELREAAEFWQSPRSHPSIVSDSSREGWHVPLG